MMDSTPKPLQTEIFDFLSSDFDLQSKTSDPKNSKIELIKKNNRKAYLKQKHIEYRQKWKRIVLRFSKAEFLEISDLADKYKMKRAPFLKICIFAYLNQSFVLPDSEQSLMIEMALNRISNRINELVRYVHKQDSVSLQDLENIKTQLYHIEVTVCQALRTPPNLKTWLEEQILRDSSFVIRLQEILKEFDS